MNKFLMELEELVKKYEGEWTKGMWEGDEWEAMAGQVYGGRFFVSERDAERAGNFVQIAREKYHEGNAARDLYFLTKSLVGYVQGEHVPYHFLATTGLPEYDRPIGDQIIQAARDLATKRIGFSEFKRIVRENS